MPKEKETLDDRRIDENLRRAFGDLLDEDVPERFRNLLENLKNSTSKGKGPDDRTES